MFGRTTLHYIVHQFRLSQKRYAWLRTLSRFILHSSSCLSFSLVSSKFQSDNFARTDEIWNGLQIWCFADQNNSKVFKFWSNPLSIVYIIIISKAFPFPLFPYNIQLCKTLSCVEERYCIGWKKSKRKWKKNNWWIELICFFSKVCQLVWLI